MVFVIDSCHRDRLMEAHSELAKLLTEKELRDALLLIFANKQVKGTMIMLVFTPYFLIYLFADICITYIVYNIQNSLFTYYVHC